jgi:hypothetical protein
LSKSDDSSGPIDAPAPPPLDFPPPPPPLAPPPDLGVEASKVESDFSVAPLPTAPAPHVKVKFSVPPPADIALSAFRPEPLFDAAWRAPVPATGRVPKPIAVGNVPVVTHRDIITAKTPAQRAQIIAQYPFLRPFDGQAIDSSDSVSSGSMRSYGGRSVYNSVRHGAEPRPEEPPAEVRSLPGRRGGSKQRWQRT